MIPASKNFLHGAVCTTAQLRNIGSKSPVEIVLDTREDFDTYTCEIFFPKLGAKCIVMADLVRLPQLQRGFQLKPLAILFSSFEIVLLLDADNWPVRNPDHLFETEVFFKDKFLLWPDAWQ